MRDEKRLYETPGFEVLTFVTGDVTTMTVNPSIDSKNPVEDDEFWG